MKLNYYINNNLVEPPFNNAELEYELNYGNEDFTAGVINITDFTWARENFDLISDYIKQGFIFEGLPFRIELENNNLKRTIFNGYIDLTQNLIVKEKIKLTARTTSKYTVDWLNDVAAGFSFEYLASLNAGIPGSITPDDFIFIPYTLSSVPQYDKTAMTILMVFTVTQTLQKEISDVAEIVADAAGVFNSVGAALKAVIKIAYLTTLLIALVKLVQDFIKFTISPVKYHAGMYVRTLFTRACEYLNLKFDSDIFSQGSEFYNEVIIPEKLYNPINPDDKTLFGFLKPNKNEQQGFFKGTFKDFIEKLKLKYNAKVVIKEPIAGSGQATLCFVRRDKLVNPITYQLPDLYEPEYTLNTEELISNLTIEFQTDTEDLNTYQNYAGSLVQVITSPKTYNNRQLVLTKNLKQVYIPFARAYIKNELTLPEKIIQTFLNVFDGLVNSLVSAANAITGAINKVTGTIKKVLKFVGIKLNIPVIPSLNKINLSASIENRIGMMILANDHFAVPKILIITEASQPKNTKPSQSNLLIESAINHYYKFYSIDSFTQEYTITGNQYKIKNYEHVPFSFDDLTKITENNRIFDAYGNEALVENLKFNPYKQYASLRVREKFLYTSNLMEQIIQPDGR